MSSFSFSLFSFFFCKIGEQEGGIGSVGKGKEVGGEVVVKGGRRVDMVQKCVHMYVNAKMIPVETITGIKGGGHKKSGERGEFKYDIVDTLKEPL
jgi:hypothetical protein